VDLNGAVVVLEDFPEGFVEPFEVRFGRLIEPVKRTLDTLVIVGGEIVAALAATVVFFAGAIDFEDADDGGIFWAENE
jgi:hypothetical protein